MKLFEYQAKELFAGAGIPVPVGQVIENAGQIGNALATVGLPCVLKAQVLKGGRGKAGLIQLADTVNDAAAKAQELFNSPHGVGKILVEKALKNRARALSGNHRRPAYGSGPDHGIA